MITNQQNINNMEIIAENKEFKIEFNGSKTYMVIDSNGDCLFATTSKRKAINTYKRKSNY